MIPSFTFGGLSYIMQTIQSCLPDSPNRNVNSSPVLIDAGISHLFATLNTLLYVLPSTEPSFQLSSPNVSTFNTSITVVAQVILTIFPRMQFSGVFFLSH